MPTAEVTKKGNICFYDNKTVAIVKAEGGEKLQDIIERAREVDSFFKVATSLEVSMFLSQKQKQLNPRFTHPQLLYAAPDKNGTSLCRTPTGENHNVPSFNDYIFREDEHEYVMFVLKSSAT